MPILVQPTASGAAYASPMVGPVNHTKHIKVTLNVLTVAEVDVYGFLKPGVLLKEGAGGLGVLIGGAAGIPLVVIEPTRLNVVVPVTAGSLLAETGDHLIAVATHGVVNRDIAEDNLGRVYTPNELASFVLAGSGLHVTTT